MRKATYYEFHTGKLTKPLALAVVSDLHNEPYEDIFPLIDGADVLLVPGDSFGCPGYLRICYCVSFDMIRRSLPAFKALIEE